jgi:hypothetical protein
MKFSELISRENELIADAQSKMSTIIKRRVMERAKSGKKSEPTKKMRNAIRKQTKKTVKGAMKLGMDWLTK